MKLKKLLLAAIAVFFIGKTAYSQVAFVDTFLNCSWGAYYYPPTAIPELNDSGFASLVPGINGDDCGNYIVIRTDKNGKILWKDNVMSMSDQVQLFNFIRTEDNNIEISFGQNFNSKSNSFGKYDAIKLNSLNGDTIWKLSLSNIADSITMQDFTPASDGGFFITGIYLADTSGSNPRMAVEKFDSTGNLLWFNKYSGVKGSLFTEEYDNYEGYNSFPPLYGTNEGGLFILLQNNYLNGSSDSVSVSKINSNGSLVSSYSMLEVDSNLVGFDLAENKIDSSFTLFGVYYFLHNSTTSCNMAFFKFDKNVNLIKSFQCADSTFDSGFIDYCYFAVDNNNYDLVAQNMNDTLIYFQIDSNAENIIWEKRYPGPSLFISYVLPGPNVFSDGDDILSLYPTEDTGLIASGTILDYIYSGAGLTAVGEFLTKYGQSYATGIPSISTQSTSLTIYPNPTSDNLLLVSGEDMPGAEVKIYNLLGQQLFNAQYSLLRNSPQTIDVSVLANGLYLITLQTGDELVTRKFIKM